MIAPYWSDLDEIDQREIARELTLLERVQRVERELEHRNLLAYAALGGGLIVTILSFASTH